MMHPRNIAGRLLPASKWSRFGCRVLLLLALAMGPCWAGPPFVTDDPQPVDLHHWEIYLSSLGTQSTIATSGTLPHVEVNNGFAPNLQWHVILPYAYNKFPGQQTTRGIGDTELGIKYRFVQEGKDRPMVGTFPLLEVPTGDAARGLGTGNFDLFLPIWLQKDWGPWTSYGGGGYWINPGDGNRNYWFFGVVLQKDLNEHLTLGGELFTTTPSATNVGSRLNFNIGGQYNFNDVHHLLFSAGRSLHGDIGFMYYLGYQWTFGPHEESEGGSNK